MMPRIVPAAALAGIVLCGLVVSPAAQTATTSLVDIGIAHLEIATWGVEGEIIILLPGTGYSSSVFGLLGPELARRGYRAIAVNPRGVRGSTGPLDALTLHDYASDGLMEARNAHETQ